MNLNNYQKDLIILTACKNIEFSIKGLLERNTDLQIRNISFDIFVHPQRDPGCQNHAHDYLRPFSNKYSYALVIFDYYGCGKEKLQINRLEENVETRMKQNGWSNRASAIIINPELEIWIWGQPNQLESVLNWNCRTMDLRSWLVSKNLLVQGKTKPTDPKKAFENTLRFVHLPRSSSLYNQLARKTDFSNCTDKSFQKLKTVLYNWFSIPLNNNKN